ncbi:MAG TPA: ABC transporter permease, partial [Vicinamibacterales bacterium]|nr:ABC transporter permease [Vicinamibacterales bacterium]
MSQIFESVKLALASIWANKLRSLLTLLGNIVAVSSIITVVSLIQGVNGAVSKAIVSDLGADSFTIQRTGIVRNQDEADKQRNNPRVTLDDARAVRKYGTTINAVMAQAQNSTTVAYRNEELQSVQVQGVTEDYTEFSSFDAERGRMISPIEIDRDRPVAILGWQIADRLFGPSDPIDKIVRVGGLPFRVVGVSAKKGAVFGNSLDEFVVIPLGQHRKLFGSRQSLQLMVKPRSASLVTEAKDEARMALRVERRLKAREEDNFGIIASDSVLDIYKQATRGIFAVLVGVVALSL